MGLALTWDLAADIYVAAGRIETLVSPGDIERIRPRIHEDTVFARERMEDVVEEMKLLHQAHWHETEAHRHGLTLNPDYEIFIRYERAGRYVLFTLRNDGRLQATVPCTWTKALIRKPSSQRRTRFICCRRPGNDGQQLTLSSTAKTH